MNSRNSNIQETDQLVNQHIDCLIFTFRFRLAYDKIESCAKEREEYGNSIVQEIRALFILLWRRTFDYSFRTNGWNQKKGTYGGEQTDLFLSVFLIQKSVTAKSLFENMRIQ